MCKNDCNCKRNDRMIVENYLNLMKIKFDKCQNGYSFYQYGQVYILEFEGDKFKGYDTIE